MVSRLPYCSISKYYADWFEFTDLSAKTQRSMASNENQSPKMKSIQEAYKLHKQAFSDMANVPKYPVSSEEVQAFLKYNLAENRQGMAILSKSSFDFERDIIVGDCPSYRSERSYVDGSDIRVCVNHINKVLENIKNDYLYSDPAYLETVNLEHYGYQNQLSNNVDRFNAITDVYNPQIEKEDNGSEPQIDPDFVEILRINQLIWKTVDAKMPRRGLNDIEYNEQIHDEFWDDVIELGSKVYLNILNIFKLVDIEELFDSRIENQNNDEFNVFCNLSDFVFFAILVHKQNKESVEATNLKELEVLMLKNWVERIYLSGFYKQYQWWDCEYGKSYREIKSGLITGVLHGIVGLVYSMFQSALKFKSFKLHTKNHFDCALSDQEGHKKQQPSNACHTDSRIRYSNHKPR